jgi:hypothetical protein
MKSDRLGAELVVEVGLVVGVELVVEAELESAVELAESLLPPQPPAITSRANAAAMKMTAPFFILPLSIGGLGPRLRRKAEHI